MLQPDFAVLDETDSGLDIDALRIVSEGVNALRGDERGFLIITHYTRILDYVQARTSCTSCSTAGSSARAAPSWPTSSRTRATSSCARRWPRSARLSFVEDRRTRRARGLRGARRCRPGAAPASGPRPARPRPRRARAAALRARPRPAASEPRRRGALGADRPARRERRAHRRRPTTSIIVMPLEQAVEEHPELVERVLRQAPPPRRGQVRRRHRRVLDRRRVRPRARRTSQIEKPIQVVWLIDEPGTAQWAHTLVVVGEHAEVQDPRVLPRARLRGPGAARGRLRALRAARRAGATSPTTRTGAAARCTTSRPGASRSAATRA